MFSGPGSSGVTLGKRARRAGISLVEVMIASTINLLLLGSLSFVLWTSYAHSKRIDARLELNSQALTALAHLKREVAESNLACIAVGEPDTLIFPSPRDANGRFDNGSGNLTYHKLIGYRSALVGSETRLLRYEDPIAPTLVPPEPGALTPPRDRAFFDASSLPPRVIARGVVKFEARRDGDGASHSLNGRIHLVLGLERRIGSRSYGVEVETSITPLN